MVGKTILSAPNRGEGSMNQHKNPSNKDDSSQGLAGFAKSLLGGQGNTAPANEAIAKSLLSQFQSNISKQYAADKKQEYTFPNKQEIEQFHAQLSAERIKSLNQRFKNESNQTIKFSDFNRILTEEFKGRKPADALVFFLYERFKRFKFSEGGHEVDRTQLMDILDFLLAMNFLARLVYEKKMRLMFELCDDDDDGCMRPAEILNMLQRTERIFCKECSKVEIDSTILLNMIADKKAEQKFQRIMSQIRQQSINKQIEQSKREKVMKDSKNVTGANGTFAVETKPPAAGEGVKVIQEFDEDNLITYREFIQAVKSIKDVDDPNPHERKFYEALLPRTLTFQDVLTVQKKEEEYRIQEDDVEEFVVFRYELSNILRKHLNEDDKASSIFGGRHPLSKVGGRQLKEVINQKDLPNEKKKEYQEKYMEMYRPPGIIQNQAKLFEKSELPHKEKLWFCNPSSQIYVREQKEAPTFKKTHDQPVMSYDQIEQKCREINQKMSLRETLHEVRARELNFEQFYQSQLPPEAEELFTLVESFKDKDSSKDKEIEQYKKNAEDKFKKVKNLVPENKVSISTLRMEEFEEGGPMDRRNKNLMRAMNAPSLNHQKIKDDLILEQLKEQYKAKVTLVLVLSQGVANNLSVEIRHSEILVSVLVLYYIFIIIKRGGGRNVNRPVRRRVNLDDDDDEDQGIADQGQQTIDDMLNDPDRKLSKKDIAKLQKRQEKDRMREAMKQQREAQDQRRAEQEAKEELEEQKRKQEEQERLEEERKKKEEEEKKEKEEYNKWKDMFSVDEVGDKQEQDAEYENKLQQFIDFIMIRKVVLFEDLAAEFSLSSKEVIDRIQRLQESGRLQGIIDDRGKFIHITEQEYESVARYIKTRGRVNKADLLMELNKIVRLQPKAEDKVKIKQEQKTLLEKVEKEFNKDEPKAYFNNNGDHHQQVDPNEQLKFRSIIKKTSYKKIKPDLKRHYPELWGRFLDNHYDPQMHQRPFIISMKTPDNKYKYQQNVGLSFKMFDKNVLEKGDVDALGQDRFKFTKFEEFQAVKEGEVMISVEHCINCHQHNTSTKHDEEKYKTFATNLQGAIREQFPLVKVIVKPISTEQDQKIRRFRISAGGDKPTCIDDQLKNFKLGAFEVQLFKKEGGKYIEKILHSKLQTGLWPNVATILEKVHYYLPRVPKLFIQLFKDMNSVVDESMDQGDSNFKDLKVTLKSSYSGTISQIQLNNYLEVSEAQRQQLQMIKKNRLMIERSRPPTASSIIQKHVNLLAKSQSSFKHRNLQSIQSHTNIRPSSASTYFMQQQRSTDNTSALTTIQNVPRKIQNQVQDTYGLLQNNTQRPYSAVTAINSDMNRGRPFSANSRVSTLQSQSSRKQISYQDKVEGLIRKGRGLGFFGDDNDRIKQAKEKQETEKRQKVKEQQSKADDQGKVVYSQLPVGQYTIEVTGNEEFLPSNRQINILNDEDKDEITIYIGMKPRSDTNIEFQLQSGGSNGQQIKMKPEGVNIKAILLPNIIGSQEQFNQDDLEDFEFEVLYDPDKGLWTSDLITGNYLINVKAPGHAETNSYAEVRPGKRHFKIVCPQKSSQLITLKVSTINIQTGRNVNNVFIQVHKSNSQQPEEGVTNKEGLFEFNIREICTLVITVQKASYANLAKKIDITQGLISSATDKVILLTLPMVKDIQDDQNSAYGIVTYAGKQIPVGLKAIQCIDGQEIQQKLYEGKSLSICRFDTTHMQNQSVFDFSPEKTDRVKEKANPSIRFMLDLSQTNMLNITPKSLDINFKNPLQDLNLQFSIVYRDFGAYNGSANYVMRTFEAPSYLTADKPIWDICFFSFPYIIETNLMYSTMPQKPDAFFTYYSKLSVFLKNRKSSVKFNEELRFDIEGIFRMDDTWLDPGNFEQAMVLGLLAGDTQKLWSAEQKKIMQRYIMKKETEDKVIAIHEDINMFYNAFTQSMMNMWGKVSYKRFSDFIQRL